MYNSVMVIYMVLVIYMFVMFYFFFLQKAENNRLKKKPVGLHFVILFFCIA